MKKNNLNFMNSVLVPKPKKSVFDLTHDVKLSCNMGYLVPCMVFDCVPGDKVQLANEAIVRFSPLVSPMYQRCNVTFHNWFIPYRILWDSWSDYITQTKTGGLLPAFPTFTVSQTGSNYTELMDYMGIPDPTGYGVNQEQLSAIRFAAYQCVYNEFYRDQNLIQEVDYKLQDGDNTANTELTVLRKRAWGHDYFTSNLPWAQKGDPVEIPIGGFPDVPVDFNLTGNPGHLVATNGTVQVGNVAQVAGPVPHVASLDIGGSANAYDPNDTLTARTSDLTSTSANLNDLRLAEALQKYFERAARTGTRLVEWIKGMFGVDLPDYTAQRPQYINGTMSPIQVSEVLNTTGISGELPQGNMAGRAISFSQGKPGTYFAREHGVVIGIMSIMPETAYQQGIEREWFKTEDPTDFLNPLFAHLGEQATINRELMAFTTNHNDTFGYLPRYSEYRTIPNRVAGTFRTTEDYWTMARIFDTSTVPLNTPGLNQAFIEADPTHRVFADTDPNTQKMYVHCLNKVRAVRPLPKFGTPNL